MRRDLLPQGLTSPGGRRGWYLASVAAAVSGLEGGRGLQGTLLGWKEPNSLSLFLHRKGFSQSPLNWDGDSFWFPGKFLCRFRALALQILHLQLPELQDTFLVIPLLPTHSDTVC